MCEWMCVCVRGECVCFKCMCVLCCLVNPCDCLPSAAAFGCHWQICDLSLIKSRFTSHKVGVSFDMLVHVCLPHCTNIIIDSLPFDIPCHTYIHPHLDVCEHIKARHIGFIMKFKLEFRPTGAKQVLRWGKLLVRRQFLYIENALCADFNQLYQHVQQHFIIDFIWQKVRWNLQNLMGVART